MSVKEAAKEEKEYREATGAPQDLRPLSTLSITTPAVPPREEGK